MPEHVQPDLIPPNGEGMTLIVPPHMPGAPRQISIAKYGRLWFAHAQPGNSPHPVPVAPKLPPAILALAASGSGSLLQAGQHSVAQTWGFPEGETCLGPSADITITAGQNITCTVPALPAGALYARLYFSWVIQHPVRQNIGLITGASLSGGTIVGAGKITVVGAMTISGYGDGATFPPIADQQVGSCVVPAIASGAATAIKILNKNMYKNGRVEAWYRKALYSGFNTAISGTLLTDTSQVWGTNYFANWNVLAGNALGSSGVIASNTNNSFTVSSWTGGAPAALSLYIIYPPSIAPYGAPHHSGTTGGDGQTVGDFTFEIRNVQGANALLGEYCLDYLLV
jgi:hypothetical protein